MSERTNARTKVRVVNTFFMVFPPFSVFDTRALTVRDGVSIKQELSHNCHTTDMYGFSGVFLENS